MDFGLTNLLVPFFKWLNTWVGSYALAVVIFTVLLRGLILPLDILQRKNINKQALIAPKVNEIRRKFSYDPLRMNQKIKELYKKEGVSRGIGCLLPLIQLPLFIALLGVLNRFAAQNMLELYNLVYPMAQDLGIDFSALSALDNAAFKDGLLFVPDMMSIPGVSGYFDNARFLWIQNVFRPDNFYGTMGQVIPPLSDIRNIEFLRDLPQTGMDSYNTVLAPYANQFTRTNGLFILPIIAAATQYASMRLMFYLNKRKGVPMPGGDQAQAMNKTMTYIIPIMSLWICASANALFSIYWFVSGAIATLTQVIFFLLWKYKRDKKGIAVKP